MCAKSQGQGGRVECGDLGYYECFSLAKPGAGWNVGRQEGLRTVTDVLRGGQGPALTERSERGAWCHVEHGLVGDESRRRKNQQQTDLIGRAWLLNGLLSGEVETAEFRCWSGPRWWDGQSGKTHGPDLASCWISQISHTSLF